MDAFSDDKLINYKKEKKNFAKTTFETIVEKGENAGNQHFLLSHNVFYPIRDKVYCLGHYQSLSLGEGEEHRFREE